VTHNTEHVFGLTVAPDVAVTLNPREHLAMCGCPGSEAAERCFSPSNAEAILHLPRHGARHHDAPRPAAHDPAAAHHRQLSGLRVATYNIHKGVRGVGPGKRLEIHNLGLAIEALDADLVFLQEVRLFHHRDAQHFDRTSFGWPDQGQAEFLAPEGYEVAYRTNAVTRHGEHGNALLARWPLGDVGHHDVSDHRFEQRGLLHVPVQLEGHWCTPWWRTSGWCMPAACARCERLADFIAARCRQVRRWWWPATSTTGARSWTARCRPSA
jgi:hypothetical protein